VTTHQHDQSSPQDSGSLLAELGVIGLEPIEPVMLGALISGEPLLLIGPHGTGKSYLLNRLCEALGLEWRHYNASLLNFDDLVGYPLPNGRGQLEYVQTPSSIWQAQAVFVDEISRCRPDMQNKLFPIIHERRVQGITLERLVYRWSAMNPPAGDDVDGPLYRGSEPLDAALADRFAFVAEMPDWRRFSEGDQERVILSADAPHSPKASARLRRVVAEGQSLLPIVRDQYGRQLAAYLRLVTGLLGQAGLECSARRAAMLLRNVASVHAARHVVDGGADIGDSALLALAHSLPHRAAGQPVKAMAVLAAHRDAWKLAGLEADDPRRLILAEPDPLRRALRAARLESLSRADFSGIVADAIASLPPGGRHALAVELFESRAAGRLVAAVAEQCAQLYALVVTAQHLNESVASASTRRRLWQQAVAELAQLDSNDGDTLLISNLVAGLFAAHELATEDDLRRTLASWRIVRAQARGVAA
jgi:MoxR-like ATPase